MMAKGVRGLAAVTIALGFVSAARAEECNAVIFPPAGPAQIHHLEVTPRGPFRFPYFRFDLAICPLCPKPTPGMYPVNRYPDIQPTYRAYSPPCHWAPPAALYSAPLVRLERKPVDSQEKDAAKPDPAYSR
jgi:hypothetical protein